MSMISEQVKELREMSIRQRNNTKVSGKVFFEIENALSEAADTIEALSAKLQAANMENGVGWILCEDRLPDEGERVLTTHEGGLNPERQVIEHVFKDGCFILNWDMDTEISSPTFGQRYAGKVIAWQPLPEPYRP